jgi:hypothetical protein
MHAIRKNANQTLMVSSAKNVLLGYIGHIVDNPVLTTVSRALRVQFVINANTVTEVTLVNTLALTCFGNT